MDIDDQYRIAEEVLASLRREVLAKLDRVPEKWEGREIRKLVHDTATFTLEGKRLKDYKNDCLIYNL
jgi:hypothetical protein